MIGRCGTEFLLGANRQGKAMTFYSTWSRATFLLAIMVAAIALLPSQHAEAQSYPSRPVTIVVPFAPGTVTDVNSRQLAQYLQNQLGQPFVIENKPGATGMIGTASVANARADGYTLLIGGNTTHSVVQSTYKKVPYDPVKSFTPIARLFDFCNVLLVHPDLPVHSAQELVDYLKANPGKLEYGYGNSGGLISGELLRRAAGVEMARVAYRSNAQGLTDLISGHIRVMMVDTTLGVPQVKVGKVRALAVSTKTRTPLLPDVPTFNETFAPGIDPTGWAGVFGPAGLPPDVVTTLGTALEKFAKDPDMNRQLSAGGTQPAWIGPGDMPAHLAADIVRWTQLAKDSGIQPE
jgi:tripartite-type tricarboxylate transporter receptor subunit TctC